MTELDDVNIRHIKLVTGDELIAIVLDNDDLPEDDHSPDVLYVQKPMQIQIRTLAEGTSFLFYESDDEEPEDDESSETEYNILPERILH